MESIVCPLELNDFPKEMQVELPENGLEGTLNQPHFFLKIFY